MVTLVILRVGEDVVNNETYLQESSSDMYRTCEVFFQSIFCRESVSGRACVAQRVVKEATSDSLL